MKKELNQKQYGFPDEVEIEKVIKRFADPNYRRINQGLWPNATAADKFKHQLCQNIASYRRENNLSEQELAKKLSINQAKVEYIIFCHYKKLTAEELINYAEILRVPFEAKFNHDHQKTAPRTH